ncbi:hypothetical protein [Streptomyces sp. NPDC020747]|uniref:hypothetical protein n=1 Tax=Streptomyces sp. NPDC020747 TaxID=3365086 RepID=UPI00378B6F40
MTAHHGITAHPKLVEEVAAAVEGVSGVAFLRPGLADRLRSASARPRPGIGGVPQAGVRMTLPDGAGPWHVEIHVVALRRARTLDVARAVRRTVEHCLDSLVPAQPTPRVTVTVTGLV